MSLQAQKNNRFFNQSEGASYLTYSININDLPQCLENCSVNIYAVFYESLHLRDNRGNAECFKSSCTMDG